MHRVDTNGSVSGMWSDGDPVHGVLPTQFGKDWFNDVQENILAVLTQAGISPVKGTYTQLRDAIIGLISGAAGSATTSVAGLIMLATSAEVIAGVNATKAVTPNTLAALAASTTLAGLLGIATNAETQAGTVNNKAVTPDDLFSFPRTVSTSGYLQIPGTPLILLWGQSGAGNSGDTTTGTFPITFPNACFKVFGSAIYASGTANTEISVNVMDFSNSQAHFAHWRIAGSSTDTSYAQFLAIGY